MEDKEQITIPYIVFEGEQARAERHIKRLWIALIVSIAVLLLSTVAWLVYLSLYDFESYEVISEGSGHANYIGEEGEINNYGEGNSQTQNPPQS